MENKKLNFWDLGLNPITMIEENRQIYGVKTVDFSNIEINDYTNQISNYKKDKYNKYNY